MIDDAIYLEPSMVPDALRAGYSGKKFKVRVVSEVTIPSYAGNWDGGSRDAYRLVELESGRDVAASDNVSAPWDKRSDRRIVLRPGFAVVEHSIFCGKDMGLTFYVHPDNAAKLLPAPAAELSPYEKTVLEATIGKKSSYGGQDRYDMAKSDCAYSSYWKAYGLSEGVPFPTRAQWQEAKDSLIAKGLLNKAGAVTTAGRNARLR
jgi:hypothetical protein